MAGKRLKQNNQPVVSPTDFQERKAKNDAREAQRARMEHLQRRVNELEEAEKGYAAQIQTLEAEKAALGSQLLDVQQDCIQLQREKNEMNEKMKTVGADAPLEDPIADDDLELTKEPAKARQLPKKGKKIDKEAKEEKTDEEEL